ncbi:MAG TPA: SCO family protein [Gaiellaceae bacterium]|nr:SCO family protein [Gaiellaceae bacterium]
MPLRRLVLIAIAGAVPLILALAGLFLLRDADARPAYRGSRPPGGMKAADFRLRSYTGQEVSMGALRDKVLVLTFLDAQCKESCPVIAATAPRALARLDAEDRGRVAFVAISTDPREDTPAAVRGFLRRYGAEGTLEYLIGPESSVRRAWQDYGVLASEVTGSDTMHSAPVRIYAPGGEWVSSLGAGADLSPRNLAHDIEAALDTT